MLPSQPVHSSSRTSMPARTYIVPMLSKALTILRLLETSDRPLSMLEIARHTGYSLSSVYRIVRTLCAHDFLPAPCKDAYTFRRQAVIVNADFAPSAPAQPAPAECPQSPAPA